MVKGSRLVRVMLLSVMVSSIPGPIVPAHAKPPLNLAIQRQQSRNEYVRFEAVIDALNITDGMTILDIGAGPGYASFLFAEKLHGTGEVYATDIREDFVRHIAGEAKRKGLTNLFSAVVKEEGLDEFYGRHRYDLVFLSNVYHCLDHRIEYFSRLRESLKPGARLVVIIYNQVPLFSVEDLTDVDGLVGKLSNGKDGLPFYERLSPTTRQLMKSNDNRDRLEIALVEDFNRMLLDPLFYRGFYGNSYFRKGMLNAAERDFANWLLMTLHEDGVPEKATDPVDPKAMRAVVKLNRLFFINRLGDYLAEDGMGAYVPAGDANRQTSQYVMSRELDAAGYEFKEKIRCSPYFDAFIMVPKGP